MYNADGYYTVVLTVTDNVGHTDTETKDGYIEVQDVGPEASFEESAHEFGETESVTFNDTSTSHDALVSWLWDFGDGETSTEEDPTHTYANDGVYTVNLTVWDVDGNSDYATATKYVFNEAPVVNAGGPYTCEEGETITLTATATDVPEDFPLIYSWDLDGMEGFETEGQSVEYTCGNGDEEVTVQAQAAESEGDDEEETSGYGDALININNVPPTADANGPYQATLGEQVCFTGTATDVVDTEFTYQWDFDYNGVSFDNNGQGQTTCTTYISVENEPGTYTVALRVKDDGEVYSAVDTTIVTVYNYNINLEAGWNLISIPLVPENDDTAIESVLDDVSDNAKVVWAYQGGEWSCYLADDEYDGLGLCDEDHSPLTTMEPGWGYYVKMYEEDILYLNGEKMYGFNEFDIPRPPVVTLTPSWNLIGHYGLNHVSKADALTTLDGHYATLLNKVGTPISILEPTKGYWLFQTYTQDLDYAPSDADYAEEVDS